MQDRLDLVFEPGASDARCSPAVRPDAATRASLVSDPHRTANSPRRAAPRGSRVDLVGLDLRLGDRAGLLRIGHHHPRDVGPISLTIACVLQVASTATSSSGPRLSQNTRSASAVRPAPSRPGAPSRSPTPRAAQTRGAHPIRYICGPSPSPPTLPVDGVGRPGGQTTPTDSRSQRIRASRRGGQLLTRARSPTYKNGLPTCVAPRYPYPGRSHRTHRARSAQQLQRPGRGKRRHLPPFIPDTNAIEALNRQLRKAIKTKGSFPSEDAARKLVYLALQNAVPQWTADQRA